MCRVILGGKDVGRDMCVCSAIRSSYTLRVRAGVAEAGARAERAAVWPMTISYEWLIGGLSLGERKVFLGGGGMLGDWEKSRRVRETHD